MRFGIFDHLEQHDVALSALYEQRLQLLEAADEAGFWCYHKAEHHFTPLDAAPSSNVFLAAASQRTSRIRFGPPVYLLPFYDPIRLIEEICALDHLSDGRLEVGVGKGISPAEHTLWGADPATARDRFEEHFAILRAGLGRPSLSFEGASHSYTDARHVFVAETDEAALSRVAHAFPRYHENLATLFKRYEVEFPAPGDPSLGGDWQLADGERAGGRVARHGGRTCA